MGYQTLADTNQVVMSTDSDGTYTDALDLEELRRCDVAVKTSGAATLTVQFSATGEFSGEEFTVTADYDAATESIEQFDPTHQYVRAKIDQNLTQLEVVGRGL